MDGYSVELSQTSSRRVHPDHVGNVPETCLPNGVNECHLGRTSLILTDKDMADHEERAAVVKSPWSSSR